MSEPRPPATAPPPAPAPTTAREAPRARVRLLRRGWQLLLVAVLGLPVATAVGLVTVLHSEGGTAWLLSGLPGLEVQAPRGALLGPEFGAQRLRLRLPGAGAEIDVRELQWRGARWRWWLSDKAWMGLQMERLSAGQIHYRSASPSPTPRRQPADLRWPLQAHIVEVSVDRLIVDDWPAVTGISASAHLGEVQGRQHRLEDLRLRWDRVDLQGTALVASEAPMPVQAQLSLQQASEAPEWQAQLQAHGPLANLQIKVQLQARRGGVGATRLDAQAQVRPFAPWPLGDVEARMHSLDLAALSSLLPQTRLSGSAQVHTSGRHRPLRVDLAIDNAVPGPWDQGGLPVRQARLALNAALDSPTVEIARLDLDVGTVSGTGQWRSSGLWDAQGLRLRGGLAGLRLRTLDTRAPAATLSGPLSLRLDGLPPPASQPVVAAASARKVTAGVDGDLEGQFDGLGVPLRMSLEASIASGRFEVRRLRARAGAAQADLTMLAEGGAGKPWRLTSQGQVADFDPGPWMIGSALAPWRQGPHRLNAQWQLALALPTQTSSPSALQWLQSLRGTGQLRMGDSWIAGTRVRGQVDIGPSADATARERATLTAELWLGRNRLQLRGEGEVAGSGETDRWRLELDAPHLVELAPLTRAIEPLAAWSPEAGRMRAQVETFGRWPEMRSEGSGEIEGLRAGAVSARSGKARWSVDTGLSRPLQVEGELLEAAWGQNRLALLRGNVSGSWRQHEASLEVAAPVQPPSWFGQTLALRAGAGTQARIRLQGGWQALEAGVGRWSGSLHQLTVGAWAGAGLQAGLTDETSWLESTQLRGELDFATDGRLLRAKALPGAARLAGGLNLRWDQARWAADPASFELRTRIEPFAVLPWLRRADSGIDWGGDLRIAAEVALRVDTSVQAEAVIRRHDGDLTVGDAATPQPLGLTDAEIRLRAANGQWTIVPTLQGRTLGVVSGTVGLTTSPQALWPDRDAVLGGAIRVAVPDLGVWAGWLPPGWRVDGALESTARLAGRFGAPALTGELLAQRVAVRNLLQGVSFTDGEMRVALQGDTARVERFSLRTGEGTLSIEGDASLGAQPQARLALQAQSLRVLGRIDRQLVASGQAKLLLQPDRLNLQGRIQVDSGLFDLSSQDAPTLDDDVRVRTSAQAPAPARPAAPLPPSLLRAGQVSLDLDLGERLRVKGRGLESSLRGVVRVSAPGGRMAVNGTVRAVGGNYAAYGQKLQIERGLLEFTGRADQPRLDILALRPNTDLRVGVAITGTADAPRVRLYSEPELGETDKLSWLVLGRGSEGLARADTTVLQRAAIALLAGEGEAPTDTLLRNLGIDELSLRQGDGEVRDTVVSLGKQLSRNWYVGYERSVNATTGTWQLIYRLAQRFTLRAQSGLENSLDLIWTWRFDDPKTIGR